MYVSENGQEVLKQDILDLFEEHAKAVATVVVGSLPFRDSDPPGSNPPHLKARSRYHELPLGADEVVCTGEYPEADGPAPLVFALTTDGLRRQPAPAADQAGESSSRAAKSFTAAAAEGCAVRVGPDCGTPPPGGGASHAAAHRPAAGQAIRDDRGHGARPQQPVGFG